MKTGMTIILVIIGTSLFGQQDRILNLKIQDSLIIMKNKHESVRVPLELTVSTNTEDTLVLYKFYDFVPAIPFLSDTCTISEYTYSSEGLNYIIEDEEGNIQLAILPLPPSYKYAQDEIDASKKRYIVNSKTLKIERKKLNSFQEYHEFRLSKQTVSRGEYILDLYPLINIYHDLHKGNYFLYFYYTFDEPILDNPQTTGIWDDKKPDESNIFRGALKSNKVKLLVK